jgi:hypothetical protein
MSTAPCSIFPSLLHRFLIFLKFFWHRWDDDDNQNTSTQAHVYSFVTSDLHYVSVDISCKILENHSYGNETEELRLEYKA